MKRKLTNILVTGGAGFIGSNFIFHMLGKYPDYRIICLDKLTYAGNLSTLAPVMDNPNFRFVKLDICDRQGVYQLFEEEHPDIVVNFAAESHVDRSITDPEIFIKSNVLGTQVLLNASKEFGVEKRIEGIQKSKMILYTLRFSANQKRLSFIEALYSKFYKDKYYFLPRKQSKFLNYLMFKYRDNPEDCERLQDIVERRG